MNTPTTPKTPIDLNDLTMTEAEVAAQESDTFKEVGEDEDPKVKTKDKSPSDFPVSKDPSALPEWVSFPQGFRIPPGKEITFLYFKSSWTDRPDKGDRWILMWPLSDADEKLAIKRTRGESGRTLSEMTKGTIRLIDGKRADWTGNVDAVVAYSVDRFWDELGSKCRQMVTTIYLKTHSLSREEQADFLENCVIIRKAIVGG